MTSISAFRRSCRSLGSYSLFFSGMLYLSDHVSLWRVCPYNPGRRHNLVFLEGRRRFGLCSGCLNQRDNQFFSAFLCLVESGSMPELRYSHARWHPSDVSAEIPDARSVEKARNRVSIRQQTALSVCSANWFDRQSRLN